MKFSIIVPLYNERATAEVLLEQVLSADALGLEKEIIVVEGNSTDGTRELIRSYEGRPGVKIVYEERPRGKGAAVRAGLKAVTGDIVLVQDGDLEYSVADYARLLKPLVEGTADIVYGSRALEHSQRWQYRQYHGWERLYGLAVNLGGVFFTGLFNLFYRTSLSDGATMFKMFRKGVLNGLTLRSRGFDYDWEISAKLAKRGCVFLEVPVAYKARSRAEGKKIRFWRDGVRVLWAILKYRFTD